MNGKATISACGTYRYLLSRQLAENVKKYKPVLFIMLNPSTADATEDDKTIRRCKKFALREGGSHLFVINLFALRATDPDELKAHKDPVGEGNDFYIKDHTTYTKLDRGIVIAAWGANPFARDRAADVIKKYGRSFKCLGKNKDGSPRHPLYIPGDYPLEDL